jgi:hypothetical protein
MTVVLLMTWNCFSHKQFSAENPPLGSDKRTSPQRLASIYEKGPRRNWLNPSCITVKGSRRQKTRHLKNPGFPGGQQEPQDSDGRNDRCQVHRRYDTLTSAALDAGYDVQPSRRPPTASEVVNNMRRNGKKDCLVQRSPNIANNASTSNGTRRTGFSRFKNSESNT